MEFKKGFDIIGDIAIVESRGDETISDKKIVQHIRAKHPRIKTILQKTSVRTGKWRLRKFKTLYGKDSETTHKEYGCVYSLDVRKVYFSPRESTERKTISDQVKNNETILVMFAGVGPYAIVIGKKNPTTTVVCVEQNRYALKYTKENIRLNKLTGQVKAICKDVQQLGKEYHNRFDRIVMPLPAQGYEYLDDALRFLKPKGIIHFYYIEPETELFKQSVLFLQKAAKKKKRKLKILSKRKVLPYGPRIWKVCIDAKIY